ncbi:hypothetical protein KIPB_001878, partial [Kipferlia bialata]|eukprot:g1878.t1
MCFLSWSCVKGADDKHKVNPSNYTPECSVQMTVSPRPTRMDPSTSTRPRSTTRPRRVSSGAERAVRPPPTTSRRDASRPSTTNQCAPPVPPSPVSRVVVNGVEI